MPLLAGGEGKNLRCEGGSLIVWKAGEVARNVQRRRVVSEHAPHHRRYVLWPLNLVYIYIGDKALHHHYVIRITLS